MEALRAGVLVNYGTAFDSYITALIRNRGTVRKRVSKYLKELASHVGEKSDTSIQRDLARKIGLPYAGVMLAARYGIVDWPAERVLHAFTRGYQAARELIPDEERQVRRAQEALAAKLRSLPKLKNAERDHMPEVALEGYQYREAGVRWAVIRIEAFNRVFETQWQRQRTMALLIEAERIEMAAAKGPQPCPKEQAIWLDGKRRRSFTIKV